MSISAVQNDHTIQWSVNSSQLRWFKLKLFEAVHIDLWINQLHFGD